MNKKCICGGYICSYLNFNDLAECSDCHKTYVLSDNKWNLIKKNEFRVLFVDRLVKQQKANK